MVIKICILILFTALFCCSRKKKPSNPGIINKPYRFIIDVYEDNVSVYELDYGATHACNLTKFYYNNIILSDTKPKETQRVSVTHVRNESFIYTNDVEELYDVLKSKDKLLDWMMTRIRS